MPETPRASTAQTSSHMGEKTASSHVCDHCCFLSAAGASRSRKTVQRLCAFSATLTTAVLYTTETLRNQAPVARRDRSGAQESQLQGDGLLTWAECQSRQAVFMNSHLHLGRFSTPTDLCAQLSAAAFAQCGATRTIRWPDRTRPMRWCDKSNRRRLPFFCAGPLCVGRPAAASPGAAGDASVGYRCCRRRGAVAKVPPRALAAREAPSTARRGSRTGAWRSYLVVAPRPAPHPYVARQVVPAGRQSPRRSVSPRAHTRRARLLRSAWARGTRAPAPFLTPCAHHISRGVPDRAVDRRPRPRCVPDPVLGVGTGPPKVGQSPYLPTPARPV